MADMPGPGAEAITAAEQAWQAWYEPTPLKFAVLAPTPRQLAHRAFLAGWAEAAAAEREAIRQLAIEKHAIVIEYTIETRNGDQALKRTSKTVPFADLLRAPVSDAERRDSPEQPQTPPHQEQHHERSALRPGTHAAT